MKLWSCRFEFIIEQKQVLGALPLTSSWPDTTDISILVLLHLSDSFDQSQDSVTEHVIGVYHGVPHGFIWTNTFHPIHAFLRQINQEARHIYCHHYTYTYTLVSKATVKSIKTKLWSHF